VEVNLWLHLHTTEEHLNLDLTRKATMT
jgi:hypothetical protein